MQSTLVRVSNRSDLPQDGWATVELPYSKDHPSVYTTRNIFGVVSRAVKGRNLGVHSTEFHMPVTIPPRSYLDYELVPGPEGETQPPHSSTDWTADNIQALIPVPVVTFTDGTISRGTVSKLVMLPGNTTALQEWRIEYLMDRGFRMVAFINEFSLQDAMPIEFYFNWSDRSDPKWWTTIQGLWVETGELLHLTCGLRWGAREPKKIDDKWITVLVDRVRDWGDAQAMTYYGHLLCLPSAMPAMGDVFDMKLVERRLRNLNAARVGRLRGVCLKWDGSWMRFGNTPELWRTPDDLQAYADQRAQNFEDFLRGEGDMWDYRTLGLAKYAGQTGSQEDFKSAGSALAVSVGDPRYIDEAMYSCSDYFRGFMHREADGSRLKSSDHPGWRTWSMLTHLESNKLTDPLGKQKSRDEIRGSGYSGEDDQHRSMNLAMETYALTGSRMLEEMFLDAIQTDLASHRNEFQDSPRAARRLGVWVGLGWLMDDNSPLNLLIDERTKLYLDVWLGKAFLTDPLRTVRVLSLGSAPTLGEQAIWSVWELSLHLIEVAAAERYNKLVRKMEQPELAQYITENCLTISKHGCVKIFDAWHCCTSVEYRMGDDAGLPLSLGDYMSLDPKHVLFGDGGWWDWILPAILILNDRLLTDGPDKARAMEIIRAVVPNGVFNQAQAEWYACSKIPSVQQGLYDQMRSRLMPSALRVGPN